jgi:hypothetical protein
MLSERRLRWSCRRLLRTLGVEPPIDVTELCRRLGEHRGRELRLMPFALDVPGPLGLWVEADRFDVIVYQSETSGAHQDHIILHEVGHIVAGHGGDAYPEEEQQILPDVPDDPGLRRLRRTSYEATTEREAELIASIIGEGMGLLSTGGALAPAVEAGRRIQGSLSYQVGWWQ